VSLPLETNKNNISNPLGSTGERYPDKVFRKKQRKSDKRHERGTRKELVRVEGR
jgi:hypothetical protein